MLWLRQYHGTATDARWIGVARRAGCTPGAVYRTYCALREFASAAKDRGCVRGFDAESLADSWQEAQSEIEAIVRALVARRIIVDDRFVDWAETQPGDKTNAVRQARFKGKKRAEVTGGNALPNELTNGNGTRVDKSVALGYVGSSAVALPTIPLSPSTRADACAPEEGGKSRGGRFIDRVKAALTGEPAVEVNHARR